MSKKKDYTRFSKPENVMVDDPILHENIESEVVEEIEPTIGVVTDCLRLNVREDAHPTAMIVGTINAETELVVDMAESTSEFYKIVTSTGIEGYCMKQFITIMS